MVEKVLRALFSFEINYPELVLIRLTTDSRPGNVTFQETQTDIFILALEESAMNMSKNMGHTVCVVDDDQVHLESMSFMLRRMGFARVEEFTNAEQAWEYLLDNGPTLIVSDWNMDPITGLDLLKLVRAHATLKKTPFLMVTANTSEDYWKTAISAGVTEFMFKPLNLRDFQTSVLMALSLESAEQLKAMPQSSKSKG